MTENLSQKVLKYEEFLNERLRSDLKKVLESKNEVCSDIAEYNQLKSTIDLLLSEKLSKKHQPLKTMIDLGCNVYAQARVDDCSKIFVSIGLGFQLEMTLEEASVFIEKKISYLTERASKLSDQAALINGRIKVVMETLRELQFSLAPEPRPRREVW